MAIKKNAEIATIDTNTGYLTETVNLAELFSEELDGLRPSFERIKIPAGGGLAYEVPGDVVLRAYATTEQVIETNERIDEIEEQKMLRLVITSSNGNIFKNNNIQTTLTAVVFSWDENITDTLDDNQFIWTRVSADDVADRAWNQAHFGGSKSIEITREDVNVRATFFCDLIDPTTRNSLLG